MRFTETSLPGPVLLEVDAHVDERGAFARTFCVDEFSAAGLPTSFPQCNLSVNDRSGTMRGMHFNAAPFGESKIVRCVRGAILDVVVDLRPDSPTRFQHVAVELTADKAADLLAGVTRVNAAVEQLVRQAPDQYLWIHDRYRTQPSPGDQPAVSRSSKSACAREVS